MPTWKEFMERALNEKKDKYGNIKSTADYLSKKADTILDSKKADTAYLWLDETMKKDLKNFIGELESFSKGSKAEFGKQSKLAEYISALKDMRQAGIKLVENWDKLMKIHGWTRDRWVSK